MKILVIGSGGREHALVWKLAQSPRVEKIFAGVDHILHAGDIGFSVLIMELEYLAPITAVLGNNDDGLPFKETEVVLLGGKKFLVHHIIHPPAPHERIAKRIEREKPDVVVFGHTHKRYCETSNGVLYLNPGYSGKPRHGTDRSVVILHLDDHGNLRPDFIPL